MTRWLTVLLLLIAGLTGAEQPAISLANERVAQLRTAGHGDIADRLQAGLAGLAGGDPQQRIIAIAALVQLADSVAAGRAPKPTRPLPSPEQAASSAVAALDGSPQPTPATAPGPAASPAKPAATTVAIVSANAGKVEIVMLDAEGRSDIQPGMRYRIFHAGKPTVTVEVRSVRNGFAGAFPVAGTWAEPAVNPVAGDRAEPE